MNKISMPSKNDCPETVILANGGFPQGEIALSILENARYLVCCDGATNQILENHHRLPDAIVGDCDSVSKENYARFEKIIHHIPEQNTNDLTKAVNLCRSQGRNKITILGATGRREDHTLGNINLLSNYLKYEDSEFEMITDYGVFNAISDDTEFESYVGQQVSLFDVGLAALTTENLRYPLENRVLQQLWEGTLNESLAINFILRTNGSLLVFREFKDNNIG